MGQALSRSPGGACQETARESHAAMCLYTVFWHGSPPHKETDAQDAVPAVPLYDSDDETTDSGVVSALAMTDPADLRRSRHTLQRAGRSGAGRSLHAPILQSLAQPMPDPTQAGNGDCPSPLAQLPSPRQQQQPAQHTLAGAVAAAVPAPQQQRIATTGSGGGSSGSSSQQRRPRYKDVTMTAAAAAAVAAAAAAAAARNGRFAAQAPRALQHTAGSSSSSSRYQHQDRVVVPLSAAALDAVGAPCRIGADLPPESLRSLRGSGTDAVGLKPYHHLRMMQLHRQQQQQQQQQQAQQAAICAQAQAQGSVWGWQAAAGSAAQIAT